MWKGTVVSRAAVSEATVSKVARLLGLKGIPYRCHIQALKYLSYQVINIRIWPDLSVCCQPLEDFHQ